MAQNLMIIAWIGAIGWPIALVLGAVLRARAAERRRGQVERRQNTWSRRWRRPWRLTALAIVTLAWASGVWAFLIEPELLIVRTTTVESAAWRGPPLRIGVISDTHIGAPHMTAARMERIVARMNGQHPSIVVLLGDYVGGHRPHALHTARDVADITRGIDAFRRFSAPLGTVAVLGNHDWYYSGDSDVLDAAFRAARVPVLENSAVRIARVDGPFWVVGIADSVSYRRRPDFGEALAAVTDDAPVIAITHQPDSFAQAPDRVALTLAGHTHCGQVNLPFFGRLIAASAGSARWPCGGYEEGGRKLFVTGGVGVSLIPARFRQPPEIVIVTLKRPA